MQDRDRIEIGSKAEILLQNEAFNDCFKAIEAETASALLATKLTEGDVREALYLTIHGLRLFRASLVAYRDAKNTVLDQNEAEYDGEE